MVRVPRELPKEPGVGARASSPRFDVRASASERTRRGYWTPSIAARKGSGPTNSLKRFRSWPVES